jgi:CubicO group peptidase (beta-lactamase class C family)
MTKYVNKLLLVSSLIILITACGSDNGPPPQPRVKPTYTYQTPVQLNDGWQTANSSSYGLNPKRLETLTNRILGGDFPEIDGVVIIKDNNLIFEHYFNGYNRSSVHELQSAVKSIDSTLIGLAIDQGYLLDVDQTIYDFLPEYHNIIDWGNDKDQITLKDLMTMRSGMPCHDGNQGECNSQILNQQVNWTGYTLQQSLTSKPGEVFSYFTGLNIVSHTILENITGISIEEFSNQYLFEPLGITTFSWGTSPGGEALSGDMLPRDMAKFGQLFIDQGKWQGQQIISASWVEEATFVQIQKPQAEGFGYGYWWWLNTTNKGNYDYYAARGANDQFIIVLPALEMVVVFTGNRDSGIAFQLLDDYIIEGLN